LAFHSPDNHPIVALPASRAYSWVEDHTPDLAHDSARAAFPTYFGPARDMMASAATTTATATAIGEPF